MVKLFVAVAFVVPLIAQNSITVTASRPPEVQADLALFQVDVMTDPGTSREDVLAVVQGSLLTAANFSSVRTVQQYRPIQNDSADVLDWTFVVTAPIRNLKSQVAQFTALQQAVAQKKNGMSISFSVQGTRISAQAAQGANCSATDLLADARARALKMATAAGSLLGGVLAMSGTTESPASLSPGSGAYNPSCMLTVKFALVGSQQ